MVWQADLGRAIGEEEARAYREHEEGQRRVDALFCGLGGFNFGMRKVGIEPVAGVDCWAETVSVYNCIQTMRL